MLRLAKWSKTLLCLLILAAGLSPRSGAQNTPAIWNGGNGTWFPTGSNATNWSCINKGFGFPCGPPNGNGWTANIGTATGQGPIDGSVILNAPVNLPKGVSLGNGAPGGLIVNSAASTL